MIFAPTASGKTALTRELFSQKGSHFLFKAQIINADSQAVYKGMNIGTAKPDANLQKEIPHHLIDILSPDQQFNVSDFVEQADKLCSQITEQGELPVVCGGSGFYIRSFLYGLPPTPVCDEKLRENLQKRIKNEGNAALYEELKQIDPQSAAKIHLNDSYRICRALEVYYSSGKTRSSFLPQTKLREQYDFIFLILEPERKVLYERIEQRVNQMFKAGLEDEVKNLIEVGYGPNSPGLKAIGYHEWFEFADKSEDYSEKVRKAIIHNSRKYAKKQYTYIRDIQGGKVISFDGGEETLNIISAYLKNRIAINC